MAPKPEPARLASVFGTLTSVFGIVLSVAAILAIMTVSNTVLAHDIYTISVIGMDIYVVEDRIVSQCRLRCCRMAVIIYQKLMKLFPPT